MASSFLIIVWLCSWKGIKRWSYLSYVIDLWTTEVQWGLQILSVLSVGTGLCFPIIVTGLSFVFKNLSMKCLYHTKIFFWGSQAVLLLNFSQFSFQELHSSVEKTLAFSPHLLSKFCSQLHKTPSAWRLLQISLLHYFQVCSNSVFPMFSHFYTFHL